MAGIGFELKKLFSRKGLVATIRAYGYAAVVCAGPMLLGFLLLLACMQLASWGGAPRHERELLVAMLTHALMMSVLVTSFFSMLTTRYSADMLYEKQYDRVVPSLFGSMGLMLVLGGLLYGTFLIFSGVSLLYKIQSFALFQVLILVWTEINYLTMLKDFRSIMLAFSVSVAAALLLGTVFIWLFHFDVTASLMAAVTIGYGIMAVWYFILIYLTFPPGKGSSLWFMAWFDKTPELGFTGLFLTLGLFGHLLIMWWCSDLSVRLQGLFYGAPAYDVPAIYAFFSILITTINFNTSVETRFYPRYREYFSLFNDGGSIANINEAERSMTRVLAEELGYLSLKQLFSTLIFLLLGTILLPSLPLGFTQEMLRTFRNLCIGYSFYAIGNSIMLCCQYFSDLKGAMWSTLIFAVTSNAVTYLLASTGRRFYGFGFILGGILFAVSALLRLCFYLWKLKFNVLSRQPLFNKEDVGPFTALATRLDARALARQEKRAAAAAATEERSVEG